MDKTYEMMVLKTLDTCQWKILISEKLETNEVTPQLLPLTVWKEFQATTKDKETLTKLGGLFEWMGWSWDFQEAKTARVHRAEYQTGEIYTERKHWRPPESSLPGFSGVSISSYMWANYTWWGRKLCKKMKSNSHQSSHTAGIVPILASHCGKPHHSQGIREHTQKGFDSVVEQN